MKYRNKTDMDLIVLGRMVKGGETIESAIKIENVNFEEVSDAPAAPVVPAAAPTPPAPQVAPAAPVNSGASN